MTGINADTIWQSLPMPALLVAEDDRIVTINLAAENFLNASARTVAGEIVTTRVAVGRSGVPSRRAD